MNLIFQNKGYNSPMKKRIFLCAINNVLSGVCNEDCKFCSQSSKYKTEIDRYSFKPIEQVVKEAKEAVKNGAIGYCLVTAGKELDDKRVEYISTATKEIKKVLPNLMIIGCSGTASSEALMELKTAGVDSYNHNLETSKEYYPKICSTHSWEERYQTCQNVKSVGLKLCCGGIFGMGESLEDRESLIKSIISLNPESIPLNFYIPNPALPIKKRTIDFNGAVEVIKEVKALISNKTILMVAGGREAIFRDKEREMFEAGANSIVIGNYLTTKGLAPDLDRQIIKNIGFDVAVGCNE